MAETKVGTITHFFDKIMVAVIKLEAALKTGDQIKIAGHGQDFTQSVASMQIEHEQISEAKTGQSIGLKLDQPAKPGDEVFKVE